MHDSKTGRIIALEHRVTELEVELLRIRTTENAAAHALDVTRQCLGLDLIDGEHPADTGKRIRKAACDA